MTQRKGITLVEVLVAIFVMSFGMLGLLTLFPVGALQMRDAVVDYRAAAAAGNAAANAQIWSLRYPTDTTDPVAMTFDPAPASGVLSRALYVDPFGVDALPNPSPIGGIARCKPNYVKSSSDSARWFTLLDDITFDPNGQPASQSFTREGHYSWAYMLRQPSASVPSVIDLTVVVYNGRSALKPEDAYPNVPFTKDTRMVSFTWSGAKPNVQRGGWILDATQLDVNGQAHGFFYRIANVTEPSSTAGGGAIQLELQTPIRMTTTNGTLVVLENVAGVFERGAGRK